MGCRKSFPRPCRRGRIETEEGMNPRPDGKVSPGLAAGGGLKRDSHQPSITSSLVSPGLAAGGGLKLFGAPDPAAGRLVSPGLAAGGGLKQSRSIVREDENSVSP